MNEIAKDILKHYGMPMRSGRYPYGSGKTPFQNSGDFLTRIDELKKDNFSFTDKDTGEKYTGDVAIARYMGLTTTQLRIQQSLAKNERRAIDVATAKGLREKGYSLNQIAEKMGYANDSSVRSLLDKQAEGRMFQAKDTADKLRELVNERGMVDVGAGVAAELNISPERLKQALYILELEGYPTYGGGVPQVTNPGKQTNLKVLCPPGTEHKEIYNFENVSSIKDYTSHDDGKTFVPTWVYPKSLDSKRISINYAETGGAQKDGLVEIRRNVDDISLGNSKYAQVRILVDNDRYIKGMAVYADDLPDGVDIRFNTNKSNKVSKLDTLKKISNDPDNPFGSLIKAGINDPTNPQSDSFQGGQSYYIDKNGKKQLSVINKRATEGDWTEWKDKLPSQFLSKQSDQLIKRQLDLAKTDKQLEFDEIASLNNPTVKKALLKSFADDCDAAAVHLQAAALPRQKYHVILPITDMKDTEVFAPKYNDGEQVALIRYPHGGTFEIPILTVNNKQKTAKNMIGVTSSDAIGINSKVAERLSGADFDGDTVMVIPTGKNIKITSTKPLRDLVGFDPKLEYGMSESKIDKDGVEHYYRDGVEFKPMKNTGTEMGKISNLITDMTIKGATESELARAVKHSMVVIDAEKHKLDYKQSEMDNGISALKKTYQGYTLEDGTVKGGASTLISRASSEVTITKKKGSPQIDPDTGKQSFKESNETYIDPKTGKTVYRTQKSTQMMEADDAYNLSSGYYKENAYADYANKMKSLANEARKLMVNTGKIEYSPTAKVTYDTEVKSLKNKLMISEKNAPKERQAQLMTNSIIKAMKQDNPDMTKEEKKKAEQRVLTNSRNTVGAKREQITITEKEWQAIQAGAISENQLTKILKYADIDTVRAQATPRSVTTLSATKTNKIQAMQASGNYTLVEIAKAVGVSTNTVSKYLN